MTIPAEATRPDNGFTGAMHVSGPAKEHAGKLTDRYGRKRCFTAGLVIYGIGALLSAAASCAARQAGRLPGRYALTPGQWTTPCHYDNVLSWRPVNSTGC